MARPFDTKAYTPQEIQEGWNKYIEYCRTFHVEQFTQKGDIVKVLKPRVPTVQGFCNFMYITEDTILNYESKQGYEDYFGTIKQIKTFVKSAKVDALVNGEGNTTGLIFDLKVNYGMNEKTIVEANITNLPITIMTGNAPALADGESKL